MEQQLRAMAAELAFLRANNPQSNSPMQFPSFPGFVDRGVYVNQGVPFLQGPSYPIQYGNPQYGNPPYGNPQYANPQYANPQYGNPNFGGVPFAGRAAIMEADSRASTQMPPQPLRPPLSLPLPSPEVESIDNSRGGQSLLQKFSEELKHRLLELKGKCFKALAEVTVDPELLSSEAGLRGAYERTCPSRPTDDGPAKTKEVSTAVNKWWQEIAKVAVRVLYDGDRRGQSELDSSPVPSKRLKRTPPSDKQLQEVLLASHTKDLEIAKLKASLEDKHAADALQRELTDTQAANAALVKQLERAGPDALAKLHGDLADKEAENAALKRSLEEAGAGQEALDGLRQAVSEKGAEVASLSQQIEEARTKGEQLTKQLDTVSAQLKDAREARERAEEKAAKYQGGGDMSQLRASMRKLEGEYSYAKKQRDLYKQRIDEVQRKQYETEADDAKSSGLQRVLDLAIEASIWVLSPPTLTNTAPLYRPELCLLTYLAEAGLLKELPADGWTMDYLTDWVSWQWDRVVLKDYLKRFLANRDVVDVNHVLGALIGGVAGALKNQQNLPKLTQNEKAVMSLQLEHLRELQGAFTGGPQWAAYHSWWKTAISDYNLYRGRESEVSHKPVPTWVTGELKTKIGKQYLDLRHWYQTRTGPPKSLLYHPQTIESYRNVLKPAVVTEIK